MTPDRVKRLKGIVGFALGMGIPIFLILRFIPGGWVYVIGGVISVGVGLAQHRRRLADRAESLRRRLDFSDTSDTPTC